MMTEDKEAVHTAGTITLTGYRLEVRVLMHHPARVLKIGEVLVTEKWLEVGKACAFNFTLPEEASDLLLHQYGLMGLELAQSVKWELLAKHSAVIPYLQCRLVGYELEVRHTIRQMGVLKGSLVERDHAETLQFEREKPEDSGK